MFLKIKEFIEYMDHYTDTNVFVKYIYNTLNDIEKRCSVQHKDNVIKFSINENKENLKERKSFLQQNDILVVDIEDKFKVIGCLIILDLMVDQFSDDIQNIDTFMKFFSYYILDPFLFAHCFTTLSNIT